MRALLCGVETVSFKMDRRHLQLLRDRARVRGCSQAAVVRELIERHLSQEGRPSLHDRAKDLCGRFAGPKDLSTRINQ
jgi:hypothetical protein